MSGTYSRRFFLSTLMAGLAPGAVLANAPAQSLRPQMRARDLKRRAAGNPEAVLAKAGLSGEIAWAVADVKSGAELEAHQGNRALPPASVAKALTALYALDVLGGQHRFVTQVLGTGSVSNGVLSGDLILAGGADPTLNTDHLALLAQRLKAAGVREVRGRFVVYDGMLPHVRTIDEGQPDHVGYSPSVSGIALNYNRVHFEWRRSGGGYAVAMDARTERYRPEVATAVMRVVNRDLPVYTYQERDGIDRWTVASKALGTGGSRWLPVRDPGA